VRAFDYRRRLAARAFGARSVQRSPWLHLAVLLGLLVSLLPSAALGESTGALTGVGPAPVSVAGSEDDPATENAARTTIWTDRRQYRIGDTIRICYTVSQPGYIRIVDTSSDGRSQVLLSGTDGTGGCRTGTISPPAGTERLRIEAIVGGAVVASHEVAFTVVGAGQPPPTTPPVTPPTTPPVTPPTTPPVTPPPATDATAAFLRLINDYRAQNGAGPLPIDVKLTAAADWIARDMLAGCVTAGTSCSHTDTRGRDPQQRMGDFGYPVNQTASGENIYWGDRSISGTAQNAFTGWRNSPPHNRNMLDPAFKAIGIARACDSQHCAWVTNFGGQVTQAGP